MNRLALITLVALVVLVGCTKDKEASVAPPAPAPAPAAEKPAPLESDTYAVGVEPGAEWKQGAPGTAKLTVTAKKGFHVNPEYPVAFKLTGATADFGFAQERVALEASKKTPCAEKAEDTCSAEFPLAATPAKSGAQPLNGTFLFSVCSADKCLIEKVPVSLALNVAP